MTTEIGCRLVQIRGQKSQAAFAQELGVHKNTLGGYERGERKPDSDSLVRLMEAGYNANWILTGQGPMMLAEMEKASPEPAAPLAGMVREEPAMHYRAAPDTVLSKADTIFDAYKARKEKAEKQYWQQSLPASFYARLVPALGKHSTDTKMIERVLERVISMVMALTVDLDTWPEHISDEHLEQLVAIASAAIARNDEARKNSFDW